MTQAENMFKELCSHSCNSNHEGDMNCGIHWSLRYAFSEDQLQGSIQVRSLGSSSGDIIDIEILAVATGVDVNEANIDCCTGLHITMKGSVVDDGRIVFDEYCGDPRYGCDDWRFDEGNMPLIFDCAAQFSSPEEQLDSCWKRANGIDPYEVD